MITYPILVFVHVAGAVGLFAAMFLELASLRGVRLADTPAEARASMRSMPGRAAPLAMLATLASGIWLMATSWGREPWIVAGFAGLVAMGIAGGAVSQPRLRRLRAALADEPGPQLSAGFRSARSSAALTASVRLRIAIGIGVLALMTFKPPDARMSSVLLGASIAAGLVAMVPTRRAPLAERGVA